VGKTPEIALRPTRMAGIPLLDDPGPAPGLARISPPPSPRRANRAHPPNRPESTPPVFRPIDPRAPSTAGGVLGHEMTWPIWRKTSASSYDQVFKISTQNSREMKAKSNVLVERDEDGYYVATVPSLPGCHTQAKSLDDLIERAKEAIELYLEVEKDIALGEFVGVQVVEAETG
jgi:predicted RNase H-like HicB family nuclease